MVHNQAMSKKDKVKVTDLARFGRCRRYMPCRTLLVLLDVRSFLSLIGTKVTYGIVWIEK